MKHPATMKREAVAEEKRLVSQSLELGFAAFSLTVLFCFLSMKIKVLASAAHLCLGFHLLEKIFHWF